MTGSVKSLEPVAAESPPRHASEDGATKDTDFMDKVKKGLKYIELEEADLER